MSPPKIALVTAYTTDWPWAEPIAADKRRYCERHGYAFHCFQAFDPSRVPVWSKILFVERVLSSCDWVFWTDADTELRNHAYRLENFLPDAGDLVLSTDESGVNNGNVFWRNCPWTAAFLREVWDSTEMIGHIWEEQAAMAVLQPKHHDHFRIVDGLCTVPETYRAGDFLCHYAGPKRKAILEARYG